MAKIVAASTNSRRIICDDVGRSMDMATPMQWSSVRARTVKVQSYPAAGLFDAFILTDAVRPPPI
ncbi:hypothetical protein B7486_73615 [cyanobacterium TDX16]|nr:hypothetical protein B7486_73615 [cyanobacterium TDX16]